MDTSHGAFRLCEAGCGTVGQNRITVYGQDIGIYIFGDKNEKMKQLMCIYLSVCLSVCLSDGICCFCFGFSFCNTGRIGLSVRFYCSVSE